MPGFKIQVNCFIYWKLKDVSKIKIKNMAGERKDSF